MSGKAMPTMPGHTHAFADIGRFPLAPEQAHIDALVSTTYSVFAPAMTQFQLLAQQLAPGPVQAVKGWATQHQHPLSRSGLHLMDPIDVLFCLVMYFVGLAVFFVIGRVTGRLEMRLFGICHNLFLVLLSAYMCVGLGWTAAVSGYTLWNNKMLVNQYTPDMVNIMFIFYISKLTEYADTYIMLLKHNYRQVSFLHMFHHTSVLCVGWLFLLVGPVGDGYWSAMVNSGIHVIMYSYYLLNLIFKEGAIRNFLQTNKFLITYAQMLQFALNLGQAVYVLFIASPRQYPALPLQVNLVYMIVLLALFGNFLRVNKKKSSGGKSKGPAPVTKAQADKKKK